MCVCGLLASIAAANFKRKFSLSSICWYSLPPLFDSTDDIYSIYLPSLSVFSHGFTTSNLVMPYWHLKNTNLLCDWSFIINIVQWYNLYLPILIYQSCLFLLWCCFFLFILIMIKQSHSPPSCFKMIIVKVGIKLINLWLNAINLILFNKYSCFSPETKEKFLMIHYLSDILVCPTMLIWS